MDPLLKRNLRGNLGHYYLREIWLLERNLFIYVVDCAHLSAIYLSAQSLWSGVHQAHIGPSQCQWGAWCHLALYVRHTDMEPSNCGQQLLGSTRISEIHCLLYSLHSFLENTFGFPPLQVQKRQSRHKVPSFCDGRRPKDCPQCE